MDSQSNTLVAVELLIALLRMSELARASSALSLEQHFDLENKFSSHLFELSLLIDQLGMEERAFLLTNPLDEQALSRWIPERVVQWVIELGPLEKKRALKNTGLVAVLNEHIHDFDLMRWETQ